MLKPLLYFAHPYEKHNTDEEKEILLILSERYGIYDPFNDEKTLEEQYGGEYYNHISWNFANDIVRNDYFKLHKSDEYFAWFPNDTPHRSIGTTVELMWALEKGKKITVLSERLHPFLLVYAERFFTSVDKLKKWEPLDISTLKVGEKK